MDAAEDQIKEPPRRNKDGLYVWILSSLTKSIRIWQRVGILSIGSFPNCFSSESHLNVVGPYPPPGGYGVDQMSEAEKASSTTRLLCDMCYSNSNARSRCIFSFIFSVISFIRIYRRDGGGSFQLHHYRFCKHKSDQNNLLPPRPTHPSLSS